MCMCMWKSTRTVVTIFQRDHVFVVVVVIKRCSAFFNGDTSLLVLYALQMKAKVLITDRAKNMYRFYATTIKCYRSNVIVPRYSLHYVIFASLREEVFGYVNSKKRE